MRLFLSRYCCPPYPVPPLPESSTTTERRFAHERRTASGYSDGFCLTSSLFDPEPTSTAVLRPQSVQAGRLKKRSPGRTHAETAASACSKTPLLLQREIRPTSASGSQFEPQAEQRRNPQKNEPAHGSNPCRRRNFRYNPDQASRNFQGH